MGEHLFHCQFLYTIKLSIVIKNPILYAIISHMISKNDFVTYHLTRGILYIENILFGYVLVLLLIILAIYIEKYFSDDHSRVLTWRA